MSYQREIPRDLFNDANLLKCIGRLCLLIHEQKGIPSGYTVEYDNNAFDIQQNWYDGSTYVSNVRFKLNGHTVRFLRPLNSKDNWPLLEETTLEPVFDEQGNFIFGQDKDFRAWLESDELETERKALENAEYGEIL